MEDKTIKGEETVETLDGVLPDGQTVDVIRDAATGRLRLVWFERNIVPRSASAPKVARLFRQRSIPLFKMS